MTSGDIEVIAGGRADHLERCLDLALALTFPASDPVAVCMEPSSHACPRSGALGVAIAVNAGAALVYSARVMDALDAKPG